MCHGVHIYTQQRDNKKQNFKKKKGNRCCAQLDKEETRGGMKEASQVQDWVVEWMASAHASTRKEARGW